MSVSRYLSSCRQALSSLTKLQALDKLTFVIGNESADLDSCVSSIAFGYLQSMQKETDETLVPVLNMPREDVKLRAELSLLLRTANIAEGDLICRDELPIELYNLPKVKFVLLDHNHFKVQGLTSDQAHIMSIIDHHVDEMLYKGAMPRIVQPCGSCTSLVVNYFMDWWKKGGIDNETQLTKLALSAILIDTSKLANQATEVDFDVVNFLRSRLVQSASWSESDQYKALQNAKRDISGLTFAQLLRRDYKEWDLGLGVGLWGVSSITTSLQHLTTMPNWAEEAQKHATDRGLDVHIIMTKHGEKELLLNVVKEEKKEIATKFIEKAKVEMLLKQWRSNEFNGPKIYAFQQDELSATRKKVATICQSLKCT